MEFGLGFSEFRAKGKYNKYTMSCENCDHFYQAPGDVEDLCQNPEVLEYDVVHTERATYCLHWKPITPKPQERSKAAFKNGVSIGGRKKKVSTARKKSRKTNKR